MKREILVSFIFSLFFILKSVSADDYVNVAYTIIDNFSSTPASTSARVIFFKDSSVESFPLKVVPIKSFNKYFAYAKVDVFSASKNKGFIYFEGSAINSEFGFYSFRNLSGEPESLKEKLRGEIETYRKDYSDKLEDEKTFSQAIVRLRKDARLIAGYDKIELLQKEKANLGYKIEEVRNKKQFLEKIIASTQESEIPRNYQNRLEELIAIIKKLAKAEGTKINLDEIFSSAYVEAENKEENSFESPNKASNSELSSELAYLIEKRRELEIYFGYEPDEFSLGVDF